jgi:AcrR family transcriptional regulator
MGNHGWGGNPPATDAEARQRIIDATARCIDRFGVRKTTLSDVATELGVTRQTIYRHAGSINDLVGLVAAQGADDFVDRMIAHIGAATTPAEAVVEGFLFCLRTVPGDSRLTLLLELGDAATFTRTATSAETIAYGAEMLRRFPVEWSLGGVSEDDLPGLAELILRLLISMLGTGRAHAEKDVRAFLDRWLVPALTP